MERKMYQLTEKQLSRCAPMAELPIDEEFKAGWKKSHHGKTRGWGMGKRNHILSLMTNTPEYQLGIWQGRVDKARGLPYSEERNESAYNLGYYRGYTDYESNRRGWDQGTRQRFDDEYLTD